MRFTRRLTTFIGLTLAFVLVCSGPALSKEQMRIISMAPSITEVLFELGLGDSVVGVTRFCLYPKEAQKKTKVGGFLDPNYEVILTLEPDMVLLLEAHKEAKEKLAKLGIKTISVDHDSIAGIIDSITMIGKSFNANERAKEVLHNIDKKLNVIRVKTEGAPRPKVLISASRNLGAGAIRSVNVAGRSSFYNDIINMAGGENAFADGAIAYPKISMEGLLSLHPDHIIDVAPTFADSGLTEREALDEWKGVAPDDLFNAGAIHLFWEDFTVIPGPRFILIVEKLARAIHPEIKWD